MHNDRLVLPGPVAFLGPVGTFSEEAVLKIFDESTPRLPCPSFDEVLEHVMRKEAQAGLIAIENNTNGTVTHAIDLLLDSPLFIAAEVTVPVVHNLMGNVEDLSQIRVVYAHAQALAQCEKWLSEHLPKALPFPVSSNAEGARRASLEKGAAGIAARRAASLYGLKLLVPSIQDGLSNQTRFLLMTEEPHLLPEPAQARWKTSIVFSVPNRPGALYDVLSYLAAEGVQMVRIESRPARNGAWDYNFYIDIEGHLRDKNVSAALEKVQKTADFYRCFGSYPILN